MSAGSDVLLTGRQLVQQLAQLGVGTWSPEAVRQWIREEPPCPIAEPADQGKPHRYALPAVLGWLHARACAERAKGFTRADGAAITAKIEAAQRAVAGAGVGDGGGMPAARAVGPAASPESGPLADLERAASPMEPAAAARALEADYGGGKVRPGGWDQDPTTLSEVEALLRILQGRDPRNWKAAEEALRIRRERLVKERQLIPVDELSAALEAQAEHLHSAIDAALTAHRIALEHLIDEAAMPDVRRLIEQLGDDLARRLSSDAGLDADSLEPSA